MPRGARRLFRGAEFETIGSRKQLRSGLAFVASVRGELGNKALHRTVEHRDGAYALRKSGDAYNGDFGTKK